MTYPLKLNETLIEFNSSRDGLIQTVLWQIFLKQSTVSHITRINANDYKWN